MRYRSDWFMIGLIVGMLLVFVFGTPEACASDRLVYVSPGVDNAEALETKIRSRLEPGDELVVAVYGESEPVDLSMAPSR